MKQEEPSRKIIWAVDPFAKDLELQRSAGYAIKLLFKRGPVTIYPIYIWGVFPADLCFDLPQDHEAKIKKAAQEDFNTLTSKLAFSDINPITVVTGAYLPIKYGVEEVISFSRKQKADLIVVSTHARKGIDRLKIGSFSETLMLSVDIPLLIVNPYWKSELRSNEILFPTDFSHESKEAFDKILEIAKVEGSHITLFHKVRYPITPTLEVAFSSCPSRSSKAFKQKIDEIHKKTTQWSARASAEQVKIDISIDPKSGSSASEAILKLAKKLPGIIAMASHSGRISRLILGSTTREVIRNSNCPVWVVHPKSRAQSKVIDLNKAKSSLRSKPTEAQTAEQAITKDPTRDDRKTGT